jgi:MinD superfamily P-loop ATPase
MIISIASGKGGTGKTLVATNLAYLIEDSLYIDCDVEEPNGHIFLKPEIIDEHSVGVNVPEINSDICTLCGLCANICEYNAILATQDNILLFNELCHGCGSCSIACPEHAIKEVERITGKISYGKYLGKEFYQGLLNIGEQMANPIIRKIKTYLQKQKVNILDCPPGTSCSMVASVANSDYTILVTEATPFGLNDLELAVDVVRQLSIPFGVVINKTLQDDNIITKYCEENNIDVLAQIPYNDKIAEVYSRGDIASKNGDFVAYFGEIINKIIK